MSEERDMTDEQHPAPVEGAPAPKRSELEERYLRLAADFDNYKKRVARDRDQTRARDRDELLSEWLDIADSLERALSAEPRDPGDWREGVAAIYRQALAILEKHDVRPVRPDGEVFDPNRHEAVGTVQIPDAEEGLVVHTQQTGYERPDRVVRPARVIVAR